MKALVFERNLGRYAASRVASTLAGSGRGVGVGPLRLVDTEEPAIPAAGWSRLDVRLAGICGSDLSTLDGHSSRYFEEIVSFPFVPGHEILAVRSGGDERVVVEPVLTCTARGLEDLCGGCASGDTGLCTGLARGHLSPGLQTGYCEDTGGGWSSTLVAHESQIHTVPGDIDDAGAVMVEPAACGVHAALAAGAAPGDVVAVIGAGTLGLVTLAALRALSPPKTLVCAAKHPVQRELASELGADVIVAPSELPRALRRATACLSTGAYLDRGADIVVDCVGSAASLAGALTMVRPRGTVLLVGMPGNVRIDLAPLWHREIALRGAYAYGTEAAAGGRRSFDLAFDLVRDAGLGRLVSATYPLERFEEAILHAAHAGERGSVKIAFDLATPRHRKSER